MPAIKMAQITAPAARHLRGPKTSPTKLNIALESPYANRNDVISRPSSVGLNPVPIAFWKSVLVNNTEELWRSKKPEITVMKRTQARIQRACGRRDGVAPTSSRTAASSFDIAHLVIERDCCIVLQSY